MAKVNVFEFNKFAGAVLMTALVTVVISHVGDALLPEAEEAAHAAVEPTKGATEAADTKQAAAPAAPLGERLAAANLESGRAAAKACTQCHTLEKGGANKQGPTLWDVVGRGKAQVQGFAYSPAMAKAGGDWSYEDLDSFVHKPKDKVPGTKMTFVGVRDGQKRADLILFLRSLSDQPKALP
ncbi:MAG: c-type cytochrome [Alphaproteobacteria bacterium]